MTNSSNFSFFVGIDMSKLKFDAGILDSKGTKKSHKKFNNNQLGFEEFLIWVFETTGSSDVLFSMEFTGIYSRRLWMFLQDNDCQLWLESGFQILRSSGIKKTKTDKVDSFAIALYAYQRRESPKITTNYDANNFLLHDLLSTRKRLINALASIETPLTELKKYGLENSNSLFDLVNNDAIMGLKSSIKQIEIQIDTLINSLEEWKSNTKLATSVIGVGKWTIYWILVYTKNFSEEFNARNFASLAGIAPFENSSGSSINNGNHNSQFAHKFLKGILHTCAMSSIKWNPKMKEYHMKKRNEGKKGYLVMNNVKNKVIQSIFAVVRSKTMFDRNYVHKLAA